MANLFGPNIEKLEAKKNVEGLIKALTSQKEAQIRIDAAQALGNIADNLAIEPLVYCLSEEDERVRDAAAKALIKLGSPAIEYMINSLRYFPRESSVAALTRIGEPAIVPLISALEDKDEGICKGAAESLGIIGDPRAVPPLIHALKQRELEVGAVIEEALAKFTDPQSIESLISALKADDRYLISRAGCVLADIGAPTVEPLLAMLRERNSNWRSSAAWVLGRIKDRKAVEPLAMALNDGNWSVRQSAATSLLWIGDLRSIEPFIDSLSDSDPEVRKTACLALGNFGDHRALVPLTKLMDDEVPQVRDAARAALDMIRSRG